MKYKQLKRKQKIPKKKQQYCKTQDSSNKCLASGITMAGSSMQNHQNNLYSALQPSHRAVVVFVANPWPWPGELVPRAGERHHQTARLPQ